MFDYQKIPVYLFFATALMLAAGASAKAAAPIPDDFTKALIDNLKQSGFQVSQGYPMLYTSRTVLTTPIQC